MALSKKQRQLVWQKSEGHCWYCGCKLPNKGWHADHVEPVLRQGAKFQKKSAFGDVPDDILKKLNAPMDKPENDHIDNMVPACAPCNLFKSVYSLEAFREQVSAQIERARKSSVNFRTAERFGLLQTVNKPVQFWFEREAK